MDLHGRVVVEHGEEITASALMQYLATTQPEFFSAAQAVAQTQTASLAYSGNAGKAFIPWNQAFCEHLKVKAEKYRSSGKEKLSHSLDRARKSILACDKELRSKEDFLAVKGVGPFISRELQDVLNKLNGKSGPTKDKKTVKSTSKKDDNGENSNDDQQRTEQPKKRRKTQSKKREEGLAKAGVSPLDADDAVTRALLASESIPRSMSLQPPRPVKTVEMTSLKRSVSLNGTTMTKTKSSIQTVETVIDLLDSPVQPSASRSTMIQSSSSSTNQYLQEGMVATATTTTLHVTSAAQSRTDSLPLKRSQSLEANPSTSAIVDSLEGSEVVLLLDTREIGSSKERHFFENKLREMDINVEVRGLPLGDVMWVVRARSGREFVCDTIIERKTADDLAISIKDGRYKEQQSRLVHVGMDRKLYLVEGNVHRISETIPISALHTAMRNTRLTGFIVCQTANRDATCDFLARVHRTVLQKHQTGRVYRATEATSWPSFQERARYQQCETVGEVFQAMLVQVPGCSSEKAKAIAARYPTPQALAHAYFDPAIKLADPDEEWKRRCKLLLDIQCGAAKRRLGPKLSLTMAQLVCLRDYSLADAAVNGDDDSEGEGN